MVPFDDGRGVRLVGELDLSTVGILVDALDTVRAGVLDIAQLTFMDASGLHAVEQYAAPAPRTAREADAGRLTDRNI